MLRQLEDIDPSGVNWKQRLQITALAEAIQFQFN